MDMDVNVLRYVEIYHVFHVFDVETAGSHVGRHQDATLSSLELGQCLRSLLLSLVAMQAKRWRCGKRNSQVLCKLLTASLAPSEDKQTAFVHQAS